MSTVNKQAGSTALESLEEAIESGQDSSDRLFSPGGVAAGRKIGKRRELSENAHKVTADRRIDYGAELVQDLVAIGAEMNISLQALTKMALQEWVLGYREHQERQKEPSANKREQGS